MEREIKFKAKQLNSGEWFEGDLVHLGNRVCIGGDHIIDGITDIDPSTVCQFTGLKDCEGNEIWEGDIIDFGGEGEVVFKDGVFYAKFGKYTECLLCNLVKSGQSVTIVGNKFDKEK